jgi:hypothetical protein
MLGAAPHFSRDTAAIDLRLFVGWLHAWRPFGGGNTRPFVALGALGGSGVISVDDPRGLDGSVTVGRHHVGAEARLGLVRGEAERPVDLYLAVAGMRLFASRLSDRLPEAGGAFALRLAAGVALPGSWWARRQLSSCTDNSCIPVGLGLLLPNTLEITAELGSTFRRLGFALGYTF